MHILIKDKNGNHHSVKKSDIRRVEKQGSLGTVVRFTNPNKNPAIFVKESVQVFHMKHLEVNPK